MSFLAGLNDAQRRAVDHHEGPLLVLAGAGSGKIRALTYCITRLIELGGAQLMTSSPDFWLDAIQRLEGARPLPALMRRIVVVVLMSCLLIESSSLATNFKYISLVHLLTVCSSAFSSKGGSI